MLLKGAVAVGQHQDAAAIGILSRNVINTGQVAPRCENVRPSLDQF
jgi:hypothetical protein